MRRSRSPRRRRGVRGRRRTRSARAAKQEIINAPGNLERRSAAGRSPEDAKAVAYAQAELKARAEQLASTNQRTFRGPDAPQQIAPAQPRRSRPVSDPVGSAVDAM